MIRTILAISGRPGLFRLISRGKNMLIVESLKEGKRMPVYSRDKVISLGDISMYTTTDDIPLADVFENLKLKVEGNPVDVKALGDETQIRSFFREVLPDFDEDRVYTSDIKKLLSWYNMLIAAGITEFKEAETEETGDKAETPADGSEK